MKISKIIPIFKGGDKEDFNNYRPISILPIMDKIITKLINNQLIRYILKHKILNSQQYGFRPKSNTSTLYDLVTTAQNHLDEKQIVNIIFIDLQKAFDTVKRDLLLRKLWNIGIPGSPFDWFRSYLSDRKQYMEIDGIKTQMCSVEEGVPQGGNLASTLFLLYINNITDIQLNGKLFLYADDIAILYNGSNPQEIKNQTQDDLIKIKNWLEEHHLTVNTKKTKHMIISNIKNINITIKYGNECIERVNHFKYLGVELDDKLNWNEHIKNVINKTSMMAGLLKRITKVCPISYLKTIYNSLFNSHIIYGCIIWACASKTKIKKVQTIQNRAIKNLFHYKRDENTKTIHTNHKILPVYDTIKCFQATHIHNIVNNDIHTNTILQMNHHIHSHSTRTANQIQQQHAYTTKMGLRSTHYMAIDVYNNHVPEDMKTLKKKKFKTNIKKHFFNTYISQ